MIDINCDMGEIQDLLDNNVYSGLMDYVTSINLACGGHAGDEIMIRSLIRTAHRKDVNVGAHPSYPDRENFGRLAMNLDADELVESISSQVQELINIACEENVPVTHVKPHGALYNLAARDTVLGQLMGKAVIRVAPSLPVMCLAGSRMVSVLQDSGLDVMGEAFADRTYEADGSLRNRSLKGALITNPGQAAEQARSIAEHKKVIAFDGSEIHIEAATICVHSDTPNAPTIAKAVRQTIGKIH
tara:strand:+ start:1010 stop:1741 length:732 start_codon:yes stop_codon:yes gene_type:complete